MENKGNDILSLQELRRDVAQKQKKGLHFIAASVFLWLVIASIHISSMPIMTKNLYTFCCSALLVPLAYFISRLTGIDFQNKENPLTALGIIFTINQILYILIAMWVYAVTPDKFLMVYAIIFGAHLLPYGWLYQSKAYYVFSAVIPVTVLLVGLYYSSSAVAVFMLLTEVIFCIWLTVENKRV